MYIKDIILFILIIITIYLVYKNKMFEKFDNNIINEEVNKKYKIDIDALRNLSSFSKFIINNNNIILPINTIKCQNLSINGNLIVEGDVDFNTNNNILDIFPVYMIIAWFNNTIPLGWAICDGTTHNSIKTPDLRGRMILGASLPNATLGDDLTIKLFDRPGGLDEVSLNGAEMPKHTHTYMIATSNGYSDSVTTIKNPFDLANDIRVISKGSSSAPISIDIHNTDYVGQFNANPHNNLPPCTALYYIMRIN